MNKHYCCTDFHGMYDLWAQIRDYCDDTDTIYFLGDAIDRGKDGLKIILEMLADSRIVYLRGNHEEFMLDAIINEIDKDIIETWTYNGGYSTYCDLQKLSESDKHILAIKIANMKPYDIYCNTHKQVIHLSHAGTALDYDSWEVLIAGREGDRFLWDRYHMRKPWPKDYLNWYIIHGHTPVQYLRDLNIMSYEKDAEGRPLVKCYADGHKFDLDLGSFDSGAAALFDLDELKVAKYFYTEVKKE